MNKNEMTEIQREKRLKEIENELSSLNFDDEKFLELVNEGILLAGGISKSDIHDFNKILGSTGQNVIIQSLGL